jgi:DNA-binding transcriptional MerR regulator
MAKSPDAFRTISEVADWLGVQAHVLRFWESKFAQVKPIKRAGGRRYYRPADMLLLGGIKKLLHDDGLTIKGTQKLLREKGVAFVADQSQPLDDLTMAVIEGGDVQELEPVESDATPDIDDAAHSDAEAADEIDAAPAEDDPAHVDASADLEENLPTQTDEPEAAVVTETETPADDLFSSGPEEEAPVASEDHSPSASETDLAAGDAVLPEGPPTEPEEVSSSDPGETDAPAMPSFRARPRTPEPKTETAAPAPPNAEDAATSPAETALQQDVSEGISSTTPTRPLDVKVPTVPPVSEIEVQPALLSALAGVRSLSPELVREIKPHLARLTRLRASMANPRKEAHKD